MVRIIQKLPRYLAISTTLRSFEIFLFAFHTNTSLTGSNHIINSTEVTFYRTWMHVSTGSEGRDVGGRKLEAFVHSDCCTFHPGGKECFSSTPSFFIATMCPALMVVSEGKDERKQW